MAAIHHDAHQFVDSRVRIVRIELLEHRGEIVNQFGRPRAEQ